MEVRQEEQHSCGSLLRGISGKVVGTFEKMRKVGEEDPRRIVHSMKVGLALTLVSLFYYFRPLYDGFGQAGMWAILTVVVVFEYTVGGTLSKSINRGCATLVAGALGVGAEYLASVCGEKGEPIILGLMVFFLATASTFTRFFPNVKRRYDYGVLIFILTFSLVAVSGFRVGEILQLAHQRLSTIIIGGSTCMLISIFVCPVWAGQDLHNLVAGNIDKLADFLEDFGDELSTGMGDEKKSRLGGYKSVLNSKATEESLANFAWWEPGHGGFKFHHPWKQYLKVGGLIRECACLIEALNGCTISSPHPTVTSEIQIEIRRPCTEISRASAKALRELATSINKKTFPPPPTATSPAPHRHLLNDLSLPAKADLPSLLPPLVAAAVLVDIADCVDRISLAVRELSEKARFGNATSAAEKQAVLHRGIVNPVENEPPV